MKCNLSIDINQNKDEGLTDLVKKYGAQSVISLSKADIGTDLSVNVTVPKSSKEIKAKLLTIKPKNKAYSYKFSGTSYSPNGYLNSTDGVDTRDISILNILATPESIAHAEAFFNRKNKIISPTRGNSNLLILQGDIDSIKDSDSRSFIKITKDDKSTILNKIIRDNKEPKNKDSRNLYDYESAMETLIISGLYRGYDILFEDPFSSDLIEKAIATYNKALNTSNSKVLHISNSYGISAIKTDDINSLVQKIDSTKGVTDILKIYNGVDILNSHLTDRERTTFDRFKKASNASKRNILEKVAKVFSTYMPGANTRVMTSYEIELEFDKSFSTKKGFIINNTVVLNLDYLDATTAFHEFGHYYMSWLKQYNVREFDRLLLFTKKNYTAQFDDFKNFYARTGLVFTSDEILEEIFVEELGMIGAKELNKSLDIEEVVNNTLLKGETEESIEIFMDKFMAALINAKDIKRTDVGFDLYTNISQLVNIGAVLDRNPNSLFGTMNLDYLKSLKDFFIEKYSPDDVFDGLISRGLIRRVGKDRIVLTDINGNTLDKDGNFAPHGTNYLYAPVGVDSDEAFKSKKHAVIDSMIPYLDKLKDYAAVRYSNNVIPKSPEQIVRDMVEELTLDEVENVYVDKEGNKYARVTEYLQKTFTGDMNVDAYVVISMFYDAKERYKRNRPDDEDRSVKEKDAIEFATNFMENQDTKDFKERLKLKKELFEFKTTEGTYLHNIAELYIRAINYSSKIEYHTKEERSYTYFMGQILDHITAVDRDKFATYFEKYFFSRIPNTEKDSKEYRDFKASYDFINENMDPESTPQARDLLTLLNSTLKTEVFEKLKGPLTFMPEVKLHSKALGIAGTIDLLVFDGNGEAHIFDYKTKQTGKRKGWAFNSPVRLTKELSAYNENAMMKASIQTSMYKLMLLEVGIKVGPSNVFYIESTIEGNNEDVFSSKTEMRYGPKEIINKPLADVSADLVTHFGKTRKLPDIFKAKNDATDIQEFTSLVSNGVNIDRIGDVTKSAKGLYDKAMRGTHNSSDPAILKIMGMLKLKTPSKKGGLVVKLYGGSEHTLEKGLTEEESIEAIKKLIIDRHDVKAVESKLEARFYDPTVGGYTRQDQALKGLLAGTSSATHEFVKLSSRLNLGVDFSGFTMVKDKITNEHRLIVLNHDNKYTLNFGANNKNIFGQFISNNIAKAIHPTIEWKNNNHNMRLFKAGLMLARMRQVDPNFRVSMVVTNDAFKDGKTIPRLVDVSTILYVTKAMIKLAEKDPSMTVPASILDMLKDEKLFEARTYLPNPIEALGEFLSSSILDVNNPHDIFKGDRKGSSRSRALKEALDNFSSRSDYEELFEKLHDFRLSLERRLPTVDARINDPVWALTDHVIMFLMNFNYNISPFNTTFMQNFLIVQSKVANTYSAAFNRKIMTGLNNVNEEFNTYKLEHNKWIQKLADDKGINISRLGPALFKTTMKKVYKNLYISDNTERKSAFILKNPNHNSLSSVEKQYLTYLKEKFQEFTDLSSFNKREIPNGWIPLMPKSKSGQEIDRTALDQARDQIKVFDLNSAYHEEGTDTIDSEFSVENRFKAQLPAKNDTLAVNFTDARKRILGINDNGDTLPNSADRPLNKIEDNLENIMDIFAIAALDTHHYRDVTAFGRALFYNVKRFEGLSGLAYSQLIETLTLTQRRVINHQESDRSNRPIKILNKFTTNAAIAGTVNQFLLEAFTNPMVTSANWLGDKLYGTLFKGTREFSLKSYTRAFAIVANDFHKDHALMNELNKLYGITSSDTRALKEMLNKLEKHSLWQSKKLMYLNKKMMETWQKITLVAFMVEQGSFDAHSLDIDGNLVYDEKKDKRFFDPEASKKVRIEKKKKYDAVKKQLAQQRNGLTGTSSDEISKRKLKKAWTTYDSNYVKEIIVELYSSMDESSKSLATYYSHMSFLFKMRTWIFAKIPRYFQKPMTAEQNESGAVLTRVEDPDAEDGFRYEYKGTATEGILYTVTSMARQLAEYKLEIYKKGTLGEHQKKNLSKLLADMFVFSAMTAAAAGIFAAIFDDDDEKSDLAKLVYQRWLMATGDVFLLKSLTDMTTGNSSMFISVSVGFRLLNAITNATVISGQALIDPETTVQDALKATNNVMRNTAGIYRSLEMFYDSAVPVEKK